MTAVRLVEAEDKAIGVVHLGSCPRVVDERHHWAQAVLERSLEEQLVAGRSRLLAEEHTQRLEAGRGRRRREREWTMAVERTVEARNEEVWASTLVAAVGCLQGRHIVEHEEEWRRWSQQAAGWRWDWLRAAGTDQARKVAQRLLVLERSRHWWEEEQQTQWQEEEWLRQRRQEEQMSQGDGKTHRERQAAGERGKRDFLVEEADTRQEVAVRRLAALVEAGEKEAVDGKRLVDSWTSSLESARHGTNQALSMRVGDCPHSTCCSAGRCV